MLPEDIQLQQSDVTNLSSRSAVREFFGRMGYDASQARETFPQAEGMPQRLQEAIKFLELSASDEFGLLNVYLIELTSVTVAHIQALATHFKSRPGQVLAVLTQDYKRLDFVLFELREVDAQSASAAGYRVLPRRFTFDRERPTRERLRVIQRFLRRLTWTEPDGLAQWDKLRSAFSIAEWSEEFFDNRGLFADYFLNNRLPEHPAWNDAALRPARDQMRQEISAARAQFRDSNESALRGGLLVPLLIGLGFQPQEGKSATDDSVRAPDFELLDPQSGDKLAVCLAYQWDRFLDGPDPKDLQTPEENPGAAVLELLQDSDWAIVTNGKHWRLYSARTESRATNFYQVDAEEIAADTEGDAFRYFWLMFRADAFRPCEVAVAGEPRAACFLEELLDGSRRYAKEVGDRLKGRVFEDIFPILAQGFIQDIRHRDGEAADLGEEQLGLVYNATLTLLYRLLFLLYAESRDLLPVAEVGGYYEKSLTALKQEIATAARTAEGQRDEHLSAAYSADPGQVSLWNRLTGLFSIIGDGRTELNVPRYNGGLFLIKPDEGVEDYERPLAEFLNSHALSDQHLAGAIDRLARDPDEKSHGLVPIDFKSLGVRQLGSIYEGLLEFKVRIAPPNSPIAVCVVKGKEVHEELKVARQKKLAIKKEWREGKLVEMIHQPGEVYLENSKHERKASGSYYTPDYIVKYIVERTVGPVLDEKLEALRGDLNRACADYRKFRDQKQAAGVTPVSVRPEERPFIQQCFDLSVLDPAMGSGHFLVTAVDFIADRLIHFLNGFPHNPVERMLNDTRRSIVDQAVREGLVLDESKLTHINLLKRHVLKRCIYGVDLNAMAVELAKVSLWLHCFTLGAPLSFLDHHLKWGNSLIGETGATGQEQAPQGGFDDISRWHDFSEAVQAYLRISGSEDATTAQVAASREGFRKAEEILRPHRQKLNVQTAGYFEEPKSATKRATWVGKAEQRVTVDGREGWDKTQGLAGEHRFFHWPLEFPEIWYEPRPGAEHQAVVPRRPDEAAFDAVVGNPPWGVDFVNDEKIYARLTDSSTSGPPESYRWFMSRSLMLTRDSGRVGMIVPNTWLSIPAAKALRELLYERCHLQHLVLVPPGAFDEVNMNTLIFTLETLPPDVVMTDEAVIEVTLWGDGSDRREFAQTRALSYGQWSKTDDLRILPQQDAAERGIMTKLLEFSETWRKHLRVSLGAQAYHNSLHTPEEIEERIYHSGCAVDSSYLPELSGRNVSRYHLDTRPAEHLATGDWLYLCPEPEFLDGPRILVLRVTGGGTFRLQACYGDGKFVPYKALLVATLRSTSRYSLFYPLALLNARLGTFFHHHYSEDSTQNLFPTISIGELNDFPVRQLDFAHPSVSAVVLADDLSDDLAFDLATAALRAHAIHHGPAGKPELRKEYLAALDSLHPHEPMPPDIPEDPADFPGREDFVHDLLALLAQRMMDLNKEKHTEIGRFVDNLQEQFGFEVEGLPKKTHIKGYHEAAFERLEAALRSNRTKLSQPVEGIFAADLRSDYEASMEILLPLEEKLTQTDRLIDQIVYRLYGLTAEEVAIVEGTAGTDTAGLEGD